MFIEIVLLYFVFIKQVLCHINYTSIPVMTFSCKQLSNDVVCCFHEIVYSNKFTHMWRCWLVFCRDYPPGNLFYRHTCRIKRWCEYLDVPSSDTCVGDPFLYTWGWPHEGFMHSNLGCVLCVSLIVVTVGKYFVTRGTKQQHFYIIFGHCVRLSLTGATLPFTQKLFKSDTPRLI